MVGAATIARRGSTVSRCYGLPPLTHLAKAKIIFDHTGLITDDVDHVHERVFRDAEFGSPPRNVPRIRNVYHLRSMVRYASHFAAPSVRGMKCMQALGRALSDNC